ncbi:MAG TPA: sulfite exporter TauE/SafE family protein [Acidimicrobiales bacterium]|nr:sulfite exporter TauE/SafE family protein [Acidimicrobiales bacterium]
MDPGPLRDVLTVLLGVASGVLSGLFGVGGAVISTPGIRLLGASATTAIGTTLPSIIPGAASGVLRYRREGLIDLRTVAATAPAGMAAAVAGALLTRVVPGRGHALMLATAGLVGFSAYRTVSAPRPAPDPDLDAALALTGAGRPGDRSGGLATRSVTGTRLASLTAVGAVAGLLAGLLGIGGGVVMVPGFTQVGGLPLKRAIATSLACVGLMAVPGTLTHAALGTIDWRFALALTVGMVPGARLGAALAIRATDRRLRLVVGGFLAVTAVLYAAGEAAALMA